jgi:hypothetical protein
VSVGPPVPVLYEDRLGDAGQFGPHAFVLACVSDRTGVDRWTLGSRCKPVPLKGNGNLLRVCREELEQRAPQGGPVFAIFDHDRITELLQLESGACKAAIVEAVRRTATSADRLRVVLLFENIETALEALTECLPGDTERVHEAVRTKDRNERDDLFIKAADHGSEDGRARVLARVPSLERLVRLLSLQLDG